MTKNIVDMVDFRKSIQKLTDVASLEQVTNALFEGGKVIEAEAKRNVRGQKLIDTGNLRASIETVVEKAGVVVVGTAVIYAPIHEFGGDIVPKNADYLHFNGKQGWVKTKKVTIPPRPFLRPAVDENRGRVMMVILAKIREQIMGAL